MPLSTVYNVITRYRVDDSGARRKVNRLAGAFGRLWDSAKWLLGGAAALGGAWLVKRMTELGVAAEKAKISIAGTFQVLSDEAGSFNQQLERADDLFKRFSKRSIESPAAREEFRKLFQGVAPAVGGLDLSNKKLAQFTQRSVGAAVAFTGQDYQQAGRDLRRILKGRAGADVKTFQALKKPLLKSMGAQNVEEFNKLAESNPGETFQALNRVLKKTDPMLEEFKNSTAGLFATAKELVNRGLLQAWKGFGEAIRQELNTFIEWFQDNKGTIKDTARVMGDRLADALHQVVDIGQSAWQNLDRVKEGLGALAVFEVGRLFGGGRLVGGLASTLEGGIASALFGGSTGLFSGLFGAVGAGAAALFAIGAAGKAVADAVEIVRTETSKLREQGREAAAQSKTFFNQTWRRFARSLFRLGDILGLVNSKTGDMVDFGAAALYVAGTLLEAANIVVTAFNYILAGLKGVVFGVLKLVNQLGGVVEKVSGFDPDQGLKEVRKEMDRIYRDLFSIEQLPDSTSTVDDRSPGPPYSDEFVDQRLNDAMPLSTRAMASSLVVQVQKEAKKTEKDDNQAAGDTNVDVTINQEITTEADPDRIAFKVQEGVGQAVSGAKQKQATAKPFGK